MNAGTSARFLISIYRSELDLLPPPLRKPHAHPVTHAVREFDRFLEIHPHLFRRMRIRAEGDGDFALESEREEFATRINLFAILPQARGVHVQRATMRLCRSQKGLI